LNSRCRPVPVPALNAAWQTVVIPLTLTEEMRLWALDHSDILNDPVTGNSIDNDYARGCRWSYRQWSKSGRKEQRKSWIVQHVKQNGRFIDSTPCEGIPDTSKLLLRV
jgi:hypothetical protein